MLEIDGNDYNVILWNPVPIQFFMWEPFWPTTPLLERCSYIEKRIRAIAPVAPLQLNH